MSNQLSAEININVSPATAALDKLGDSVKKSTETIEKSAAAVTAKTDKVSKEFNDVAKDAQKMGEKVKSAAKGFDVVQSELNQTVVAADKASNSLGKTIPKGTNGATNALTNLNRVIQDAPFGIIGIANNIDPLIQSFQSLSKSTGGVGGALKALGSSLLGPQGILFAFSALSTLSIVAVQQYGSLGNAFDALTGRVKVLTEEQKKFKEQQQQTQESIFQQRIETEQLVKVSRGDIGSKAEQEAALRKLNSVIPDYIGVLDKQNIKTQQGIDIIDKYVIALEKQAIAELLVNRVATLSVKRLDEEQRVREELTRNLQRQADLRAQLASVEGQRGEVGAARRGALGTQLIETQKAFEDIINAFQTGRKGINEEIDRLRKEIDNNTVIIDPSKNEDKDLFNFEQYLKNLIKQFEATARTTPTKVELPIETVLLGNVEFITGQAKKINQQVESIINTELATQSFKLEPNLTITPKVNTKDFDRAINEITRSLRNGIEDAFSSIGEGLGDALGGATDAVAALAKGFLDAFGSLISSIGKALIQYGIVKTGLDKVIKGGIALPGAVAIGLGLAAVAIGQLVKTAIPKFATGGIVTGPTLGLIGEGGQPEVILPLSKINQFMEQGGGGGGRLEAIVSGDALRFILNRNDRKQRRLL